MSVLASAAAVVAAGTFGGHVAALQGAADRAAPAPAVTLAGTSVQRSGLGQNVRDPAEPKSAAGLSTGLPGGFRSSLGGPFSFTPALRTAPVRDARTTARTGASSATGSAAGFGLPAGASAGLSSRSGASAGSGGASTGSANSADPSPANQQAVGRRPAGATAKPAASATVAKAAASATAATPAP
jgi:hypothetical protein